MDRKPLLLGLLALLVAVVVVVEWPAAERELAAARPVATAAPEAPEASGERVPLAPVVDRPGPAPEVPRVELHDAPSVGVRAAVVGADSDPAIPEGYAVLRVALVSKESNRPIPGIGLYLDWAVPESAPSKEVEGARTEAGRRPKTADDGVHEFTVPVLQPYFLRVTGNRKAESVRVRVPALEPGERRDLKLELLTGEDLEFFGRVVSDTDGRALAEAEIEAQLPSRHADGFVRSVRWRAIPVDVDGGFHLQTASWRSPTLRVSAPGHLPGVVEVGRGHEDVSLEQRIPLKESATLNVSVVDSDGHPVGALQVVVSIPLDSQFAMGPRLPVGVRADTEQTTDEFGTCVLEDLYPGVSLDLGVFEDGKPVQGMPSRSLELAPGEVRSLEWRVEGGVELRGRLIDQYDEPVAHQEVWVKALEEHDFPAFQTYEEPTSRASTDADGAFVLEGLQPGTWIVGPAPPSDEVEFPDPDALSSATQKVEIERGKLPDSLIVRAWRGLYLGGTVLVPSGSSPTDVQLSADARDRGCYVTGNAMEDGRFLLGPLSEGDFELSATLGRRSDLGTETVAHAGEMEIVLRLERGLAVTGFVRVGDTDRVVEARVTLLASDVRSYIVSTYRGRFRLEGLEPGSYVLMAQSSEGLFGFLDGVVPAPAEDAEPSVIDLEPAATLRVKYAGSLDRWGAAIHWKDWTIGYAGSHSASGGDVVVPAGALRIDFWREGEGVESRTIEVTVGEQREVVFQ